MLLGRNQDATYWPNQESVECNRVARLQPRLDSCLPKATWNGHGWHAFCRAMELLISSWHVAVSSIKLTSRISYAVQQSARFTDNLKASHGADVKRICHYHQGTQKSGFIL